MTIIKSIQNRIYDIRGQRVMLDFDLAQLYEVEARALNQAVKRNSKRFPADFMFRLTSKEYELIQSQIEALSQNMSSQSVMTLPKRRPNVALPYAFTEQGVTMLSGVLHSDRAVNMNIAIMRAFVEIRQMALSHVDLAAQLRELNQRIGEHDLQLSSIYDAIENLLDEKTATKKWEDRNRIGFREGK